MCASDQQVLNELVGDSVIGEDVVAFRKRLAVLSDDEKFKLLFDWVLPGRTHLHFRLEGVFTPLNPAFASTDEDPRANEQLAAAASHRATRVQIGGNLVAPAFDLVDVAAKLGRLDDLRNQLESLETDNVADQRARLSLLFLIHLARIDDAAATASLTQLFDVFLESNHSSVEERWPETLAMTRGLQKTPPLKIVSELLYLNYEKFTNDVHGWRRHGDEVWDHHFFSLLGTLRLRESDGAAANDQTKPLALKHWASVSHFTARTRGQGLPPSYWSWDGQQVSHISGHGQDYLLLRSPLQGNFEIECEVSSTAWRETELLVAGRWIGPNWNRVSFNIGSIRTRRPKVELVPPMSRFDGWSRYRVVIRDGFYSMFFNGRKLHEEPVGDTFEPWIAIRSESRSLGGVRSLRVTGNPVVPEFINLAAKKALLSWAPYYPEAVSDDREWHQEDEDGNFGIVGRRDPELAGSFCESLLQYQRPMLEDGTIEYEFFYEPGKSHVHPAMDRLTFLLEPAGVDIHWATDGVYDRTDLSPDNRLSEPKNRRGSGPLPLKIQDWNRLRLTLRDDTVFLYLNGESIYERKLEATNQRTFGLFHYADQTEVRVRNIVWRGDWPKQVSPLREQELFVPDHPCLDGLESLKEVFTHSFTDELPETALQIVGTIASDSIRRHPKGLQIVPPVREQWTGIRVNYLKPIYGNFDATLRFADLKMNCGPNAASEQMLLATDESGVGLRCARSLTGDDRSDVSAVMTIPLPDGTRRYFPTKLSDEAGEGTFRLVRRGATVHSLIAHGDSSNFRYVGSHELPSAASAILLSSVTSLSKSSSCDVVLKELMVRSNTTEFEKQIDPRITSLNQFTSLLPKTYRHRFAASGAEGFAVAGELEPIKSDGGLHVRAGNDQTTGSSTLTSDQSLEGDFDLCTTLNADGLTASDSFGGTASISVKSQNEQATLLIRRVGKNAFDVTASVQRGGLSNPQAETVATESVKSIDSLRLIRIQKTILFVYSEGGLSRLLGQADFESASVAKGGVQLEIGGQSGEVLWKSLEVRMSASSQ
ncbi:MAG: DUF1583 domain-containing protein [Rhodopirellula sp.]|nr:DUF1583 domain-containing protein [Rhodopirellula sp.]